MRLYFAGSLTLSTYPDEPDAKSKEPRTYAIFEATSDVGFVEPPHNPTPLPDDGPPLSSGLYGASSGQQLEPDDNKSLTYA
jgi:hypothetical protein